MSSFFSRAVRHALLLVVASTGALAQTPAPDSGAQPITLRGAISEAIARNPQLLGFAHRLRAQEGRIESAALAPPLELRAELENFAGTGSASGIDLAEATFSLSRVIE